MNRTNELLDAFTRRGNLINAEALVRHMRRNPQADSLLSEDQAGTVRNAERMLTDPRNA